MNGEQLLTEARAGSQFHFYAEGRVIAVRTPLIHVRLPVAAVGDSCLVFDRAGEGKLGQITAVTEHSAALAPFDGLDGINPGAKVLHIADTPKLTLPREMLGRVFDSLGRPLGENHTKGAREDKRYKQGAIKLPLSPPPPPPLERSVISQPLATGVKSIDGLLTLGKGQRVGLFAPAGVGKSTLLGMIARQSSATVNVIALVAERGREVREFLVDSLREEGLARSVVIVTTSDEGPLRRYTAALAASSVAEYYRSQGKDVLLLVDSLTRTARALREISLAAGELPVRQGFPSAVFSELARLVERAGCDSRGSITAIYTVLTNSENDSDPLADELRGLLDGHIILSEDLATSGVRPAIDVTASISRLLPRLQGPEQQAAISRVTRALYRLNRERDALLFGAKPDEELQMALNLQKELNALLNQAPQERTDFPETQRQVLKLAKELQPYSN